MAGLWQRTGNVTVTNGSKTITGFGTKWKTGTLPIQKGHTFYGPDNAAYEVDTVVSDTEILLVDTYRGGTMANQPYRIDITRTSTISQFAADLASLVAKYRSWFDGMMTWLTGSGDVAILNPDTGANVTIPSWKKVASEGEGQTARAKTEADKAAASAALAGDIVVASALPLPDVWAPLSDSLRMITGYGREVKVGEDVVSQMVNFSRNSTATYIGKDGLLKTAAANEPRFEKEGLLLEGQSQNLVVQSEKSPMILETGSHTISPSAVQGYNLHSCVYNSGDDALVFDTEATLQAADGTGSFVFNSATVVGTWACYFNYTDGYSVFWPKNSSVFEYADLGNGLIRASRKLKGTTLNTIHLRCGKVPGSRIDVGCYQIEALPFASSYIPTNGAAVTRAADQAWLPISNTSIDGGVSVAAECDVLASDSTYPRVAVGKGLPDLFCAPPSSWYPSNIPSLNNIKVAYSKNHQCFNGVLFSHQINLSDDNRAQQISLLSQYSNGLFTGFGHIRNLRIWHRDLSVEQLKAVA